MDLDKALEWVADRKVVVLVTLRSDGRPQSSDVLCQRDGDELLISVTADRAKTANMRRDPRVVVHASDPGAWSYVSLDGEVTLSPVTTDPTDATSDELVAYYEAAAGEPHEDWDEYRAAMIAERRQIAHFRPRSAVGQING